LSATALVVGQNTVWIVFSLMVASFFCWRLYHRRRKRTEADQIMAGVVLVALGSASHRLFWVTAIILDQIDFFDLPEKTLTLGAYAWGAIVLVLLGYTLHLSPLLRHKLGRHWLLYTVVFAAVGWFGSAVLYHSYLGD
jgi:high-affinity Fe2+/Pb2+ permease